jgi:hypothetical protein
MKPFIWDYEDALVNRDAAVTWILCCKKGLMHKDTAKIIALYVFNGFEYANGALEFIYKNNRAIRILSWKNGIFNEGPFDYKSESLRFIGAILDCVYDENFLYGDKGIWNLNSREPTKHQRLQILKFICTYEITIPFDVHWIHNYDGKNVVTCKTIGDVISFMKNYPGNNTETFNWYDNKSNILFRIPRDGPVSICHRYKF